MNILTIPRPPVDSRLQRERELIAELRALDSSLEELDREIADFQREHFGVDRAGTVFMRGESPTARAEIDCKARILAARMDRIRTARDRVLYELSEL